MSRGDIASGRGSPAAARAVGNGAAFVAAVEVARRVGPSLFADPEPSWAPARLVLALTLAVLAGAFGAAAAGLFLLWSRTRAAGLDLSPLPLPRSALFVLFAAAVLVGGWLRLAALDDLPYPTWHDDLLLAPKALALEGRPADFRDAIRPVTDGRGDPTGTVGVLYLEAYRLALLACGTTVFGVRLMSALGGLLSVLTGAALARALLPRGGAVLAAILLAGLRWHLILSRWSWNMIVLAPILDVAALCALRARRRGSLAAAGAAGVCAGVGAHVYLSAWIGLAAIVLLLAWPSSAGSPARQPRSDDGAAWGGEPGEGRSPRRAALAAVGLAGFLAAVAPLFFLDAGRQASYFARSRAHNVLVEMKQRRSAAPLFEAASTAVAAPWLADPEARHDLPGVKRLPLVAGLALAAALARAFCRPADDLSAFLFSHAAAAVAASAAWGEAGSPNGSRFAYLTGVAAVGVAAGLLWVVRLVPRPHRLAAALAVTGLAAVETAAGARDLERWARARGTFNGFIGQETLVGRAALRWSRYGEVRLDFSGLYSPLVVDTIRRLAVAPRAEAVGPRPAAPSGGRLFRFLAPGAPAPPSERVVERVRDAWGREWAVVVGARRR